jgi:hypothetical protein
MKNRAKCKLCSSIIESHHSTDYIYCKCGEIYVDGGDALRCGAKDWGNFLRIDDDGNEIIIKLKEDSSLTPESQETNNTQNTQHKPSKNELLEMLKEMIANIESLPSNAMSSYITHYDYVSLLILLAALFKADD